MHFTAGPPLPANRPPPHYQTDSNKTLIFTAMKLLRDSVSSIDESSGCTADVLQTRAAAATGRRQRPASQRHLVAAPLLSRETAQLKVLDKQW